MDEGSASEVATPRLPRDWASGIDSHVVRPVSIGGRDGTPLQSAVSSAKLDTIRGLWSGKLDAGTYSARSTFIRALSTSSDTVRSTCPRRMVAKFLETPIAEWLFGSVIFLNFVLIVLDTDWRAARSDPVPAQYADLTLGCFGVYCVELSLRIFSSRLRVFTNGWIILDILIVVAGALEYMLMAFEVTVAGSSALRAMRLVRILRLLRAIKLLGALRELRKLLDMMASCMKTLFWSFLLCFVVLSLWSIVAVEFLADIVHDMYDEGVWPDCDVCSRYFGSVMHCNLFFFQTVIAGDSWGAMAVPVVERHPWAILIFGGALLTMVFGVLNLVVAVVVDTFADLRAKDMSYVAMELESDERAEKKELCKIFEKIDKDNNGELSFAELEHAAQRVPEFRHTLRALDIDRADLQQLFELVDRDGSGGIDPGEFIETLYRVKNTESKTATKIIKHYLMHMLPALAKEQQTVQSGVANLTKKSSSLEFSYKTIEARLEELHAERLEVGRRMCDIQRHVGLLATQFGKTAFHAEDPSGPPVQKTSGATLTTCVSRPQEPPSATQSINLFDSDGDFDVDDAFGPSVAGPRRLLYSGASCSRSQALETLKAAPPPPPPAQSPGQAPTRHLSTL